MSKVKNISNYYIYAHFTKDTNELFYIGKGRGRRYLRYFGRNDYWEKVYKKHGVSAVIILEGMSELEAYEEEYRLISINSPKCNLSSGGAGGATGYHHTEAAKKKISDSGIGRRHSEESIQKMIDAKIGFRHSKEAKLKMSKSHIGMTYSDKTKKLISEFHLGKKWALGSKRSEEQKKLARLANKGAKCYAAKKVRCEVTGKTWECAKDAANELGIIYSTLINWLNPSNNRKNSSSLVYYEKVKK